MNVWSIRRVSFDQRPERIDEQVTVFVVAFDERWFTVSSIQRTGQMILSVLSGSQYHFLDT